MTPRPLPAWLREAAAEYDTNTRTVAIGFASAAYETGWNDAIRELAANTYEREVDDDPAQDRSPLALPAGVDGYPVGGR
jgi:cobalamin biosynthesis Mg chelatase CobN